MEEANLFIFDGMYSREKRGLSISIVLLFSVPPSEFLSAPFLSICPSLIFWFSFPGMSAIDLTPSAAESLKPVDFSLLSDEGRFDC